MSRKSAPVRFGSVKPRMPLVLPGQRIGLLGGSFNPPHDAHRLITYTARRRLGLNQVWWVVTPGNPLKSHDELAPLADRMAHCRRLVKNPKVKITDFEADLPTAYTAATLSFLIKRLPGVHFVWLMGADNLAGFHRWQDWEHIANLMPIAVVDRPGYRYRGLASRTAKKLSRGYVPEGQARQLALKKPPAWTFLTGRLSWLSSTAIRKHLKDAPTKKPE